ncbi:MAG: hypothetical protein ACTHLW_11360 [Verrucomicrobiota bacterium]
MKTLFQLLTLAAALGIGITLAADKPALGGPKGGRLLESIEPKAEFFLEQDRTVCFAFYDAAMKPIPVGSQSVTVIAETKEGNVTLAFEKRGDVLVSQSKLPEGDGYNLVVQFKPTPDARPRNFRFKLETHTCAECQRAEYACTCDE